jgi:hypothetical protein
MSATNGRILVNGAAATVAPGLLVCALLWAPGLGQDFWREPLRSMAEEQARGEKLDASLAAARRQQAAKRAILADVTAGRLTLPEAAARFRDVDRQSPWFFWDGFRLNPGASDDERHCREVITQLRATMAEFPATEGAARRLEAELEELLRRDTLRLLAPPAPACP